ncbi:CAP-associated domain-containing protein [Paenibacillus thermotolerans]|uniref:CAP-associated domain-containing protein n=1 Tax=Paenibacillus thermotolerans TaxID=3027807 RepID=UPI0023685ED2|nr:MULTISPECIES: CAP-associated domain-containing protein [unclassified Paenibacillus]
MKKAVAALLFIALVLAFGTAGNFPGATSAGAEKAAFADIEGHWAEAAIEWGAGQGVVQGFPDGTFRPSGLVTESQFLAMLFRAFPQSAVSGSGGSYWYSPYYQAAAKLNWPVAAERAGKHVTRGQVAQIIAASQGELLNVSSAVELVLGAGLAQGKGAEGFAANDTLTRAEAVQFVRNVVSSGLELHPAEPRKAEDAFFSVGGVAIGDSEAGLIQAFGEPDRKDASEYGFIWYVYNADYRNFSMFGISGGTVVAAYANGGNWVIHGAENDLNAGRGETDALRVLGEPLSYVLKGNTRMMLGDGNERDTFVAEGMYVTVFYDVHQARAISGVQAIDREMEQSLKKFYAPNPSAALRESYEREIVDLANSARVKRGLQPLQWDAAVAATARKHSADMAENGFFDHMNLSGQSPFDRMKEDGIRYRSAGENIAAGQTSAIFAHEGWMNSEGHRRNVLGDYTRLGVGVAFSEADGKPYYTQNFITPLK